MLRVRTARPKPFRSRMGKERTGGTKEGSEKLGSTRKELSVLFQFTVKWVPVSKKFVGILLVELRRNAT